MAPSASRPPNFQHFHADRWLPVTLLMLAEMVAGFLAGCAMSSAFWVDLSFISASSVSPAGFYPTHGGLWHGCYAALTPSRSRALAEVIGAPGIGVPLKGEEGGLANDTLVNETLAELGPNATLEEAKAAVEEAQAAAEAAVEAAARIAAEEGATITAGLRNVILDRPRDTDDVEESADGFASMFEGSYPERGCSRKNTKRFYRIWDRDYFPFVRGARALTIVYLAATVCKLVAMPAYFITSGPSGDPLSDSRLSVSVWLGSVTMQALCGLGAVALYSAVFALAARDGPTAQTTCPPPHYYPIRNSAAGEDYWGWSFWLWTACTAVAVTISVTFRGCFSAPQYETV